MKRAALVAVLLSCAACDGCKRGDAGPTDAAASAKTDAAMPPRCVADGASISLDDGDRVGSAVLAGEEIAIGVVRASVGRRVHGVVVARADLSTSRFVELGNADGDEPPPEPAAGGAGLIVAYYMHQASDGGAHDRARIMGVRGLSELSTPLGEIPAQADESFDYDLAAAQKGSGAMIAWDEDAPSGDRGVVKIARVAFAPQPVVVSQETSDAESPRVVARAGGYWVAWASSRAESTADGGDHGESIEGPGETRRHRWIEAVAVDENAKLAGAPIRLTSAAGHAGAFAIASRADDLLLAVVDEDARADGAGGRVRGLVVRGATADASIEIVGGGVGRASIDLVGGSEGGKDLWSVAYTDEAERVHFAPWIVADAPLAEAMRRDSTEPAFESGRVLASDASRVFALSLDPSAGGRAIVRKLNCR